MMCPPLILIGDGVKKLYYIGIIIYLATECDICHSYCISHGKTEVVVYLIPHVYVYFCSEELN